MKTHQNTVKRWDSDSKEVLLARCESTIQTLQDALLQAHEEKMSLLEQCASLQKSSDSLLKERQQEEKALLRQKQERRRVQSEYDDLKARVQQLQSESRQLAYALQRSCQDKKALEAEWQRTLLQIQNKFQLQERRRKQLQTTLHSEREEATKIRQSRLKEQSQISRFQFLQKQNKTLSQQLERARQQVARLDRQTTSLRAKLEARQDYFSFQRPRQNDLHDRLMKSQQSLNDLRKEIQLKDRQLLILRNQKENLAAKLDRQRKQYHQLARSLAQPLPSISPIKALTLEYSRSAMKESPVKGREDQQLQEKRRSILQQAQRLESLLVKNLKECRS